MIRDRIAARPRSDRSPFSLRERMADTIRSSRDFLGDVRTEMQKVTWPDTPQLKNSTFVIVVFVVVLGVLIFGMDAIVSLALTLLRGVLGG